MTSVRESGGERGRQREAREKNRGRVREQREGGVRRNEGLVTKTD